MSNNICNDEAYRNAIDQKMRMQFFHTPPIRYNNLESNPYNIGNLFTKFNLDMRRKAEILQYKSNHMSTQTNSPTKAEVYSRAVSGRIKRSFNRVEDISLCPIVPMPSSASGVPGNLMLYNDQNVILYNYIRQTSYGIIPQENETEVWNYTKPLNIYTSDTDFTTITSIYMERVDRPQYTFKISTPIVLSVSGSLTTDSSYTDPNALEIRIPISVISLKIKYSSTEVVLATTPTIKFTSFNDNKTINMGLLNFTGVSYNAKIYLGLLEIDNLVLNADSGYIYDVQVKISPIIRRSENYSINFNVQPATHYYYNAELTSDISYNTPTYTITGDIPQPIPAVKPVISVISK